MMRTRAAEGSDDSTQWQQVVAVVEGGGALEAVMRLRNTEALTGRQGVVYTCAVFWARAGSAAKGGEWMLAKI